MTLKRLLFKLQRYMDQILGHNPQWNLLGIGFGKASSSTPNAKNLVQYKWREGTSPPYLHTFHNALPLFV